MTDAERQSTDAFIEIADFNDFRATLHTAILQGTGVYLDCFGHYKYLGVVDAETIRAASALVGRAYAGRLLFDLFDNGSIDLWRDPGLVAETYSYADFPTANMEEDDWVNLFREAGYTHDGERTYPPDSVILYRGCQPDPRCALTCPHDQIFGLSWTSDLGVAQMYADRDLGHGSGNVYVHEAGAEELLAYVGTGTGTGEDEYLLDPCYLSLANVAGLSTR